MPAGTTKRILAMFSRAQKLCLGLGAGASALPAARVLDTAGVSVEREVMVAPLPVPKPWGRGTGVEMVAALALGSLGEGIIH